ncbi:MAG: protein kinase [Sandaracinaceae bacterium]|nr:protein kinase [Sandaracinaceae bacterium]
MNVFPKVCPHCGAQYDSEARFCTKDGTALKRAGENDPWIGKILLDQFRIEEQIGVGGMGIVYRARQLNLDRDLAIKILHPDLAQNEELWRRLHREARIATQLDHPHCVRVLLFGKLPEGPPYIVMEYLSGQSLADLLAKEGHLPLERAAHIVLQVAEALGEAHGRGIVHRDIKPENVFLVSKPNDPDFVKVLDFGIARLLDRAGETLATASGKILGTARYISPEAARGEPVDPRSDVYSLAVMFYEMLCGRPPFDSDSVLALLRKHVEEEVPPLRSHEATRSLPAAVEEFILQCLAKDPSKRPADGHAFGRILRETLRKAKAQPLYPENSKPFHKKAPFGNTRRLMHALAFLGLGASVVFVIRLFSAHSPPPSSPNLETLVHKAQEALKRGQIDGPETPNLVSITDYLLHTEQREAALRLRQEGAQILLQRARQALQKGQNQKAKSLAEGALRLDPANPQIVAFLNAIKQTSGPFLELPPKVTAREPATITVRWPEAARASPPPITLLILREDGRVVRRIKAAPSDDPGHWVARYAFPNPGKYTIELRDDSERTLAKIELTVAKNPQLSESENAPPTLTQGSLSVSPQSPTPPPQPSASSSATLSPSPSPISPLLPPAWHSDPDPSTSQASPPP